MKTAILAVLTLTLFASTALAQDSRTFGNLTYPAPGNIDWDEGSVELWFTLDRRHESKDLTVMFFDIHSSAEPWHFPIMFIGWGKALAQIGYTTPQQSYVWAGKLDWQAGERHYLVWTWSGRLRSIFIDGRANESGPLEVPMQGEGRGRSAADVPVEGWIKGAKTAALLSIGRNYSPLTMDEIRISSIARSPSEIAQIHAAAKPPTRDSFTLLLDHCDGGPAEVISGFSGEKGGTLSGKYKVVPSQFGKAIQLWDETKP